MAVGDATGWYTRQEGDPATGFISAADAIASVTQIYTDLATKGSIVNADISASAAIALSKLNNAVVTFSNADATVAATTHIEAQIGTMSASRTVTLPAANAVAAGYELIIADVSGTVTSTNTIVIARAGSDTINGATSATIGAAYGWRRLISDGTSKWTFDGGVVRISDTGTVTSTMIADGTITNTDINASAAIATSKIASFDASVQAAVVTLNPQANDYTLVLGDAGKLIQMSKGTATTLTIPLNASVAFPVGTRLLIKQSGAGQVTIAGAGGVTLNAAVGTKTSAQYGVVTAIQTATDTWTLFGDLAA